MKYYIVRVDTRTGTVEYKRYKCIDGWSRNKDICWQFSKQGATKIVERLRWEHKDILNLVFIIKEANQDEV